MNRRLEKLFKKDKTIINHALEKYLMQAGNPASDISRAVKYAVFPGGKRLRPILCLESSRACGGNIKKAIPIACAIEFIHNFSLVHDDLPSMDDDDTRRGKPSTHIKFGEAIAILAGDALLNLAFGIISNIKDKNISTKFANMISKSIGPNGIIGGQALDIKYKTKKKTESMALKINSLKTGALFQASLISGAMATGASPGMQRALNAFGKSFGSAFQIYDDIHDRAHKGSHLNNKKVQLGEMVNKAKSSLEIFGKKADNLRYLADKLVLSFKF